MEADGSKRRLTKRRRKKDLSALTSPVPTQNDEIKVYSDIEHEKVSQSGSIVNISSSTPIIDILLDTKPDSHSQERNNRLLAAGGVTGIKDEQEPIIEYAQEPILPLAEACAPLNDILHDLSTYVQMALDETPSEPPDNLTIDESAAIRLYTIEWEKPHRSLYSMLNYTLKTAPRSELRPYFKYMKLFLTALVKLPCVPPTTVWRGVTKNLSDEFPPGTLVTWWAFSSCTTELSVLENNMYLGTAGERTLFSIEVFNGRTVRAHSHFVTEDEILLLPGTLMEVQSQFSPAAELTIIHMKQIIPVQTLLEPPFEGAHIYPPQPKPRPWYKKKTRVLQLALLILACIAGIIVGAVVGTRKGPPPPICFAEKPTINVTYYWSFNCNDTREDITGLYNATAVNGLTLVSPDFGGGGPALQLIGSDGQYLIFPQSFDFIMNTSFTFTVWTQVTGYQTKTLISDCSNNSLACIVFYMTDYSVDVKLVDSIYGNILEDRYALVMGKIRHDSWLHLGFVYNNKNRTIIFYLDGLPVSEQTLNLTGFISKKTIQTTLTTFGLNSVTHNEPFTGIVSQIAIAYWVRGPEHLSFDANVLAQYDFNMGAVTHSYGPNDVMAFSQSVYRSIVNNQSTLLFNSTDSYFQVLGFTLLHSNANEHTIGFWLYLDYEPSNSTDSGIALLQLMSVREGSSSNAYYCLYMIHLYPNNGTLALFLPDLFELIVVNGSFIPSKTWVHIAIVFQTAKSYLFYQNGTLVYNRTEAWFSGLISDNLRYSLTMGAAYLNGSIRVLPSKFVQMKCFAKLPILKYKQMYGNINLLVVYSRALSPSEVNVLANRKDVVFAR